MKYAFYVNITIFVQGYDVRLVWNSRLHKVPHYQQQLAAAAGYAIDSHHTGEKMQNLWASYGFPRLNEGCCIYI